MSANVREAGKRLRNIFARFDTVAVAVSGGVDSLTLATVAHEVMGPRVTMHHATSPAVPAEATVRTRALASDRGWSLDVFDAGEFADPRYRANPVNRCFFCKTNLYGAIAARTRSTILSGTNLDDLGEYRPGLDAARDHEVRHPFVGAGIDKATVRALSAACGLGAVAALPSAPCLASRVETGIVIDPSTLAMIDAAEIMLRNALSPGTVRCRVRGAGIVVELDAATLVRLRARGEGEVARALANLARNHGLADRPIAFAAYRIGSAFLRAPV
jgi:uncharacterized protein